MLRALLTLLSVIVVHVVSAQVYISEDLYYPYSEPDDGKELEDEEVFVDSLLYQTIHDPIDSYGLYSRFVLPRVSLLRRGTPYHRLRHSMSGLEMRYADRITAFRLGARETEHAGFLDGHVDIGDVGRLSSCFFDDFLPSSPWLGSVRFSGQGYLLGARTSFRKALERDWKCFATADVRTGRDLYVDGVFTHALSLGVRCAKNFRSGHQLAFLFLAAPSMRGERSASTEEAFALTGDRLYNPSWGFQSGKVRNARVRRDFVPVLMATGEFRLSESTLMRPAVSLRAGAQRRSSLGWYDARTPLPDNYRYLPSFSDDEDVRAEWMCRNPDYTQINWDELIHQNRMRGGEAAYALEERVSRLFNLQARADFSTRLHDYVLLDYGAFFSYNSTRNFKRMKDLLGAGYLLDKDYHIEDDDTYGTYQANDLRHPNRRIGEGDRFGYDYFLKKRNYGVGAKLSYRRNRWRCDLGVEFSREVVWRDGRMEKELFPAAQSYGRSRKLDFSPYTIKVLSGYVIDDYNYIEATAGFGEMAPWEQALFVQPQYNNLTVFHPDSERFYTGDLSYSHTNLTFDVKASLYVSAVFDGLDTYRSYDDIASEYCDVMLSSLATLSYGLELSSEVKLARRCHLALTASVGDAKYIRDARLVSLSDVDNHIVEEETVSHCRGCRVGHAPRCTFTAAFRYNAPHAWGVRLSGGWAGGRHVEPALNRRTERMALQHGVTEEALREFVTQERLPDAFAVNASVLKSFYFQRLRHKSKLFLVFSVNNLLGRKDMIQSGYESSRAQRYVAGDELFFRPHATRYTYAYPRTFLLSATYSF